jgi:hypothetical protein
MQAPLQTMLGDTIIFLQDEQFIEGYEAGRFSFRLKHRNHPLTEQEIYHELMQTLCTAHLTDRWKAGYVLGWAITLQEPYLPRTPEQRAEVTEAMLLGIAASPPPSPCLTLSHLTLSWEDQS